MARSLQELSLLNLIRNNLVAAQIISDNHFHLNRVALNIPGGATLYNVPLPDECETCWTCKNLKLPNEFDGGTTHTCPTGDICVSCCCNEFIIDDHI